MTRPARFRPHAVVLALASALLGSGAASGITQSQSPDGSDPEPAVANLAPPQVTAAATASPPRTWAASSPSG